MATTIRRLHSGRTPPTHPDRSLKSKHDSAQLSAKANALSTAMVRAFSVGIGDRHPGPHHEHRRGRFAERPFEPTSANSMVPARRRVFSVPEREAQKTSLMSAENKPLIDSVSRGQPVVGEASTAVEFFDDGNNAIGAQLVRLRGEYRRLKERQWSRAQGKFASPLKGERKELNAVGIAIDQLKASTGLADLFDSYELAEVQTLLEILQRRVGAVVDKSDEISAAYFKKARAKEVSRGRAKGAYERTDALGFKKAYLEVRELYALSQSLIERIQKNSEARKHLPMWALWEGSEVAKGEEKIIIDKLYALNLIFDTKAKWYLASASQADLDAHTIAQKAQLLQQLRGARNEVPTDVRKIKAGTVAELESPADYFEIESNKSAWKYISNPPVLYKNERRVLSSKLLLKPFVQKAYRALQQVRSPVTQIWGFNPQKPYLSVYTTKQILAEEQGVRAILQEAYRALGVKTRPLDKVDTNTKLAIAPPSTDAAYPLATPILAPTTAPAMTEVLQAVGAIDTLYNLPGAASRLSFEDKEESFPSMKFDGIVFKPMHELLSVAHTRSLEKSSELFSAIAQKIWMAKSNDSEQHLPAHLQGTYDLFKKHPALANPSESQAVAKLDEATAQVARLAVSFANFEKLASSFYEAVLHRRESHFAAQRYRALTTEFSKYQLTADRLPDGKKYNSERALTALARVWDSYSTALGAIELLSLTPVLKHYKGAPLSSDVNTAVEKFNEQYQALASTIGQACLPVVKEGREGAYRQTFLAAVSTLEDKGLTTADEKGRSNIDSFGTHPGLQERKENANSYFGYHIFGGIPKHRKKMESKSEAFYPPFSQEQFQIVPDAGKLFAAAKPILFLQKEKSEVLGKIWDEKVNFAFDLPSLFGVPEEAFWVTNRLVWRNGEVHYMGEKLADTKSLSAAAVYLLSAAKTNINGAKSLATSVQLNPMGSELAYHVLRFPELGKNGIVLNDLEPMKACLSAMTEADKQYDKKQLNGRFIRFFNTLERDKKTQLTYFGLNGIGALLDDFSKIQSTDLVTAHANNKFSFVGMDLFKKEVTEEYFERLQESGCSAHKFCGIGKGLSTDTDIFQHIGVRPMQVKAILQQSLSADTDSLTVSEFLARASSDERVQFFKNDTRGQQLLAAYVLIVNGANNIKKEIFNFSPFASVPT